MQILQLAHAYAHTVHAASNTQNCTAALRQRRCRLRLRRRRRRRFVRAAASSSASSHTWSCRVVCSHSRTLPLSGAYRSWLRVSCLARFVMNLNYTWRACKCFRQHIACCCLRLHKEAVHEFSTQRQATRNCRYHCMCVCASINERMHVFVCSE